MKKVSLFLLLAAYSASSSMAQLPLTLDTTFRAVRITYPGITDALPLENGSVVVTGGWILDNSINSSYAWMRLLPNGDIDPDFYKTLAGGGDIISYPPYYYTSGNRVPRRFFQSTGDYDNAFSIASVNWSTVHFVGYNNGDAYVQDDGKILFTGDHQLGYAYGQNLAGHYCLLRANEDATLDSTFKFRDTDGIIWSLEHVDDGRFFVSGVFNTYDDTPVGRVLRIWPDGSLDTTYHTPIIKGYAKCFIHQPNGRMIVGGQFVLPNEPDTMHLMRLMPDGALDTTFDNHTQYKLLPQLSFADFGLGVYDIEALDNGTIIVAGNFTHIDGQLRRGIALIDTAGHLLNTAFTGAGCGLTHDFNSTFMYSGISAIDVAPDGSIFLSGAFHGFDDGIVSDTAQRQICKLHGLHVGVVEHASVILPPNIFPNPGNDHVVISWPAHPCYTVTVRDAVGRVCFTANAGTDSVPLDTSGLPSGCYFVEVSSGTARSIIKWIRS